MKQQRDLPLRKKLSFIVLLTNGVLIGLMTIFFVGDKFFSLRHNMVSKAKRQAQGIAMNSTAALTLDQPKTAQEILSCIMAEPGAGTATILRPNGKIFVTLPHHTAEEAMVKGVALDLIARAKASDQPDKAVYTFSGRRMTLVQSIVLNHKSIGYVLIRADLSRLYVRMVKSCLIAAGVLAIIFIGVHTIIRRLLRTTSEPLLMLVNTIDQVEADQNYALRADKNGRNELGPLVDGFNNLLQQIQFRERQLEHQRRQLKRLVTQNTRTLARSKKKLEQEADERRHMQNQSADARQMEAIGKVAAGVAHDLNNILSGIVSYPDLLLMQLPEESDMRKPISTIKNSGRKAAAIVRDLLTLAGREISITEVVNLPEILKKYLDSPEYGKLAVFHPHVRISRHISPDTMNISGSPVQLEKIIMNLVANAAEAIEGTGQVTITIRNQYIDKPIRGYDKVEQGDYVLLHISDTGQGIADHDLQRIFEPFYIKKQMGRSGTGLEMAVVRNTVKDHKGYIDIQSQVGVGTTFSLYFPVARQAHGVQEPVQLIDYKGDGQSILVVDDIEEQRRIASAILTSLGYEVHTVHSGEAAIAYLDEHHADILLLDMVMPPYMDGLDTYKHIVSSGKSPRAIIASGYPESERVKKAIALGAGAYLRKPYTLQNLARAVYLELHG